MECMDKQEMCAVFWWENLKEGNHIEDLGVAGTIIEVYLQEIGC